MAIVSFRHPTFIQPADVSVFGSSWDLRGALWETFDRPDVTAHPWEAGALCGSAGVIFADETGTPTGAEPYPYGRLFFVDVEAAAAKPIGDQASCESAAVSLTS